MTRLARNGRERFCERQRKREEENDRSSVSLQRRDFPESNGRRASARKSFRIGLLESSLLTNFKRSLATLVRAITLGRENELLFSRTIIARLSSLVQRRSRRLCVAKDSHVERRPAASPPYTGCRETTCTSCRRVAWKVKRCERYFASLSLAFYLP